MVTALACLIAAMLGATAASLAYDRELRRMARFLRTRERTSNQRVTVQAPGRGLVEIARAINGELDEAQAERAQDAERRRDFQRDLASLSHDIRTPLTGAKGFLQLAQDEMKEAELAKADASAGTGAEGAESAEGEGAGSEGAASATAETHAESGARRASGAAAAESTRHYLAAAAARLDDLGSLLGQLFDYTRADDPGAALEFSRIPLLPVLADVLVGHYPAFEQRGWEPRVTFADEGLAVNASEEALARIFDNLVSNALRHGTSPLSVTQAGRAITFANDVADPDALDVGRVFERFYRADAARNTRGTGLGLATSAKLAGAMGMSLEASLEGNTFAITLVLPDEAALPRA